MGHAAMMLWRIDMDGSDREDGRPDDPVLAKALECSNMLVGLARAGKLNGFVLVMHKRNPEKVDIQNEIAAINVAAGIGLARIVERAMPKLAETLLSQIGL